MALTWIDDHLPLPPTSAALGPDTDMPGLLAAGGRVTPARLEEAYRHGVFPWFSPGQPPLWWSPDPRMVLPVQRFVISPSLRKTLRRFIRSPGHELRIDHGFRAVISACAQAPRAGQHGTWIVPEMMDAYCVWHAQGRAHSVETWVDGELAGGLYGVGIGAMFFGESMFTRRTDASKIALAALVAFCRHHGITLIDCQQHSRHLASFGAVEVPRQAFETHLNRVLAQAGPARWTYDPGMWAHLNLSAPATAAASLNQHHEGAGPT